MKRIPYLIGGCLVCLALFSLPGCMPQRGTLGNYTNANMDFSAVQSVAVLPFRNLTSDDQAAERVRDSVMGMLLATEAFYVLPAGEVARGTSRVGLRDASVPTADEIKSLGKILEVGAVMSGVLREYGQVRSGSVEANLVSLSLQLIETQSGVIIWSASATRGGVNMKDRMLGGGGQPMNDVTEQVVNELLDKLFGE